jgi:hypothetical protein
MLAEPEIQLGPKFFTPAQLAQRHEAFTLPMLRWWLMSRHENGLDRAVRKVGRRLFLDENQFLMWIDSQHE